MTIEPLRFLEMKAQSRVDTARSLLRENIKWTINHLQEELQRLEAHDEVYTISWSAMSDLPKDCEQFRRAKEALAEIKSVQMAEQD
ncbi:MAG: hypothetical protein K2X09_05930 [Rickettsiales bacterium]|nr:hypothetical protein [Rickettsiales bacterium]